VHGSWCETVSGNLYSGWDQITAPLKRKLGANADMWQGQFAHPLKSKSIKLIQEGQRLLEGGNAAPATQLRCI